MCSVELSTEKYTPQRQVLFRCELVDGRFSLVLTDMEKVYTCRKNIMGLVNI